jgi:hypothetical protein
VQERRDVDVAPGEASSVEFTIVAESPGDHEIAVGTRSTTLAVSGVPAFDVHDLRLAPVASEILAGTPLEYHVDVTNTGTKAGTYDAALRVDGAVAATLSVPVEVGDTETLRFAIEAGAPGTHIIELDDEFASLTVLAPAAVAVTDLQLTQPGVNAGGSVGAVVTVENTGGVAGSITFEVRVDGRVVATREVAVAGGEIEVVQAPVAVSKPGRHTVAVGSYERELTVWKLARPANGTILVNKVKGGSGRLTLKCGECEDDALVVLAADGAPRKALLAVYVRAGRSVTVNGVKDGRYIIFYTFGERWDSFSRRFTSVGETGRFVDTIRFRTTRTATAINYTVWTLTLFTTSGGNAPTDPVGPDDIPPVP